MHTDDGPAWYAVPPQPASARTSPRIRCALSCGARNDAIAMAPPPVIDQRAAWRCLNVAKERSSLIQLFVLFQLYVISHMAWTGRPRHGDSWNQRPRTTALGLGMQAGRILLWTCRLNLHHEPSPRHKPVSHKRTTRLGDGTRSWRRAL
jgi:hypothetical protein